MFRLSQVLSHLTPATCVRAHVSGSNLCAQLVRASSHNHHPHSHGQHGHQHHETSEVQAKYHPNGCLTLSLHRAKALNALNLNMIRALSKYLNDAVQPSTSSSSNASHAAKVVLIYGEGEKAFCAGGDIRALAYPEESAGPYTFFKEEYTLNNLISILPLPYVSILRGIVMGGGVGISLHGTHRVVTDNTLFAMPETGIGLFPDVGGTYFLSRLGAIGMYLALTGERIGAADCLYAGVGTHYVPSGQLSGLINDLESSKIGAHASETVDHVLAKHTHAHKPEETKAFLKKRRQVIEEVFSAHNYEDIFTRLEERAKHHDEDGEWCKQTLNTLKTKSPTSLRITFYALHENLKVKSLSQALKLELRIGTRIAAENKDFQEGVKAIVVDKKHKPVWQAEPTREQVYNRYFAPFTKEEGYHELSVPAKFAQ